MFDTEYNNIFVSYNISNSYNNLCNIKNVIVKTLHIQIKVKKEKWLTLPFRTFLAQNHHEMLK